MKRFIKKMPKFISWWSRLSQKWSDTSLRTFKNAPQNYKKKKCSCRPFEMVSHSIEENQYRRPIKAKMQQTESITRCKHWYKTFIQVIIMKILLQHKQWTTTSRMQRLFEKTESYVIAVCSLNGKFKGASQFYLMNLKANSEQLREVWAVLNIKAIVQGQSEVHYKSRRRGSLVLWLGTGLNLLDKASSFSKLAPKFYCVLW